MLRRYRCPVDYRTCGDSFPSSRSRRATRTMSALVSHPRHDEERGCKRPSQRSWVDESRGGEGAEGSGNHHAQMSERPQHDTVLSAQQEISEPEKCER